MSRLSLDAASEPSDDDDDDREPASSLPAPVARVLRAAPWREPPCEPSPALLKRYVAAVVAALSEEQRRALRTLRERLGSEMRSAAKADPEVHDAWLVRYLRGKQWDVDLAERQARGSLQWRAASRAREWPRDKLLPVHWPELADEPVDAAASAVAAVWRATGIHWHGCDFEGRPVYLDRMVGMDVRAMQAADPDGWAERVVALALAEAERGCYLRVVHSDLAGLLDGAPGAAPPFEQGVVIVDCSGLSLSVRKSIAVFRAIAAQAADNYPDSVHRLLVVNAPRIFASLFGLVKGFIDPNTRAKVQVIGVGSLHKLHAIVPREALPPSLGGCSACPWCDRQG